MTKAYFQRYYYTHSRTPKARYSSTRKGARRRGIPFELTLDQFVEIVSSPCVYAIDSEEGIRYGADRKDNSLGYTRENCQPCCFWHNHVKSDVFTHEQMLDIVQKFSIHCRNAPDKITIEEECNHALAVGA